MSFSSYFFRWTSAQARSHIQDTIKQKKICIVNFVYFAQAMKFRVYEGNAKCKMQNAKSQQTAQNKKINSIVNSELCIVNYKQALQNSDLLCIDGIAMQIFDRVWQFFFGWKRQWTDNLNGTDFLPYILEQTKNQKVAIIMSTLYDSKIGKWPEWMEKWLSKLKQLYPHIDIIFKHQTLFSKRGEDFPFNELHTILSQSQKKYDHILFLNGIWGPAQEIRAEKHKKELSDHNLIILNNGATIDYYSGFETRAPKRVIKMRIGETLRRVITQPEKNFKKLLAMFGIVRYWYYLLQKVLKKS